MYEIIYDGDEVYTVIHLADGEPLSDFNTRDEAESFVQDMQKQDRQRYIQEEIDAYGDVYESPPQSTSSGEFAGGEFWISDDGEPRFG